MLLVHDDQPRPRERRKDRRARADHHRGLAAAGRPPRAQPLRIAERRMQHREWRVEARREPCHQLRRERDLRHQHQRLFAACHDLGDRTQVHLGLAAAGHAVQQERRVPAGRRADRRDRVAAALASGRGPCRPWAGAAWPAAGPRATAVPSRAARAPARARASAARAPPARPRPPRRALRAQPPVPAAGARAATAAAVHRCGRRRSASSVPRWRRRPCPSAAPRAARQRSPRRGRGGSNPPPSAAARAGSRRAPATRRWRRSPCVVSTRAGRIGRAPRSAHR